MAQEIVQLGFAPRIDARGKPVPTSLTASSTAFPEPVASALAQAREATRPVFIDFYAEWCAPCKIIEGKIIPDSRVQAALDGYIFVRVDMDIDLKAGQRFNIVGMPTLLVLSGEGEELFRHVGLIDPGDLAEQLLKIRATQEEES
jgi:thiol:disulfide interchange protein DsbD